MFVLACGGGGFDSRGSKCMQRESADHVYISYVQDPQDEMPCAMGAVNFGC